MWHLTTVYQHVPFWCYRISEGFEILLTIMWLLSPLWINSFTLMPSICYHIPSVWGSSCGSTTYLQFPTFIQFLPIPNAQIFTPAMPTCLVPQTMSQASTEGMWCMLYGIVIRHNLKEKSITDHLNSRKCFMIVSGKL